MGHHFNSLFIRWVFLFLCFTAATTTVAQAASTRPPKLVIVSKKNIKKVPRTSVVCTMSATPRPVLSVSGKLVTADSYIAWISYQLKRTLNGAAKRSLRQKMLALEKKNAKDRVICNRLIPTATPTSTPTPTSTSTPTPTLILTPPSTPKTLPSPKALPDACTSSHGENCPILFKISPEAVSGDVINITGGTFTSDSKVLLSPIGDDGFSINDQPTELQIISRNLGLLQTKIPANLPKGLWAVWITQRGATSNTLFINQAKVNAMSSFAGSPGQLLRLWGRALTLGNRTSKVIFSDGVSNIEAHIQSQDDLKATVVVPSGLVAGTTYTIMASNGAGGDAGFFSYPTPFTAMNSAPDPLGLGVWWVNEINPSVWLKVTDVTRLTSTPSAVGNGIHDDTAAIQNTINTVGQTGGGIVYLPSGTYRITQTLHIDRPNVIIKGAGKDLTKIVYGLNDRAEQGAIYFTENNVKYAGVSSMTIEDQNATGLMNLSIGMYSKSGIEKIFIDNVRLKLGQFGQCIVLNADHLLIKDSESTKDTTTQLYGTPGRWGTAMTLSGTDIVLENNIIRYATSRVALNSIDHLIAINNQFIRDGSPGNIQFIHDNQLETGGVEFSFSRDVVFDGNTAAAAGITPDDHNNDGETFMTQSSIYNFYNRGDVTAATATTVTDSSKSWGANDMTPSLSQWDPKVKAVIAVTRGPGLGQWRTIVGHTSKTIEIDRPWDIIPVPNASSYTITEWTVRDVTMVDNSAINGNSCVEIYSGGVNVNIHRTTCDNSGAIWLLGWDANIDETSDVYTRYLLWDTSIFENILYGSSSTKPSYIKVDDEQFLKQTLHGNTVLNSEIRDNSLTARTPIAADGNFFTGDGHIYATIDGAGHESQGDSYYPDASYGLLGIVVSGNSSSNYVLEDYSHGYPYVNTPRQQYFRATVRGADAVTFEP